MDRGRVTWEVCLTVLHMTSSGNQTPKLFVPTTQGALGLVGACVLMTGELLIPYCLCLHTSDGYLVDKKCVWVAKVAWIPLCYIYSQGRWDCCSGVCPIPGRDCRGWIWSDHKLGNFTFLCHVLPHLSKMSHLHWFSCAMQGLLYTWKQYCTVILH